MTHNIYWTHRTRDLKTARDHLGPTMFHSIEQVTKHCSLSSKQLNDSYSVKWHIGDCLYRLCKISVHASLLPVTRFQSNQKKWVENFDSSTSNEAKNVKNPDDSKKET